MGIYSKKFYPLVFFDEPEKAPEELAEIFPITDSTQILSEIIKGTKKIKQNVPQGVYALTLRCKNLQVSLF